MKSNLSKQDLILHFAKSIIANPHYVFTQKTRKQLADPADGSFKDPILAILNDAAIFADVYEDFLEKKGHTNE